MGIRELFGLSNNYSASNPPSGVYALSREELNRYFVPESWNQLPLAKKGDVVNALEQSFAAEQGRPARPVLFRVFPDNLGEFNPNTDEIYLNRDLVLYGKMPITDEKGNFIDYVPLDDALQQIYDTIAHEGRHAYQADVVKHPERYLESPDTVHDWQLNNATGGTSNGELTSNYYQDGNTYLLNPVEVDARNYGEEKTKACFNQLEREFGPQRGYAAYQVRKDAQSVESTLSRMEKQGIRNAQEDMRDMMEVRADEMAQGKSITPNIGDDSRFGTEEIRNRAKELRGEIRVESSEQTAEQTINEEAVREGNQSQAPPKQDGHSSSDGRGKAPQQDKYYAGYPIEYFVGLSEGDKDIFRQNLPGQFGEYSYDQLKAIGDPYAYSVTHEEMIKSKTYGGSGTSTKTVPGIRTQYQQAAWSLVSEKYSDWYSNPDSKRGLYGELSQLQDNLGYYPDLDKTAMENGTMHHDDQIAWNMPMSPELQDRLQNDADFALEYGRTMIGDLWPSELQKGMEAGNGEANTPQTEESQASEETRIVQALYNGFEGSEDEYLSALDSSEGEAKTEDEKYAEGEAPAERSEDEYLSALDSSEGAAKTEDENNTEGEAPAEGSEDEYLCSLDSAAVKNESMQEDVSELNDSSENSGSGSSEENDQNYDNGMTQ